MRAPYNSKCDGPNVGRDGVACVSPLTHLGSCLFLPLGHALSNPLSPLFARIFALGGPRGPVHLLCNPTIDGVEAIYLSMVDCMASARIFFLYFSPRSPLSVCICAAVRVNQSTERVNCARERVNGARERVEKCVNDGRERGGSSVNDPREQRA